MKKLVSLICILALALSLTACSGDGSASGDGTYTVGICQLVQHPALDAATQGFKDALTEKLGDKVTFMEQNASGDSATCSVICNQFVGEEVDLIMANATPALLAAQSATGTIPILGTSVTDYASALEIDGWTGATGTNISGTSDRVPESEQAKVLNELFPDAVNVGIVFCSAEPNSKVQAEAFTEAASAMGYTLKEYTFADSNDVAQVVQTACDESDVLYIPTDNTAASNTELINNVALNAGVPIVCGEEGLCKGCGIATLSISYYNLGYKTGEMAYEILVNGANPGEMEIAYADFTKEYNPAICEALGITIPEGYVAIPED
ncbi:MAG: ABC transporter substrate-binding protein [Firmicutes bacterium]|nr:ABC transporter substrate-binding protein [Bacillota bacterium]